MAKFIMYKDKANQYRWQFKANNGKIVADSSEGYHNKSDCQNGIDIVRREAPTATTEDTTANQGSSAYRY